jgi:hypothetical protein
MLNDIQKILDMEFEKYDHFKKAKVVIGPGRSDYRRAFTVKDRDAAQDPFTSKPFQSALKKAAKELMSEVNRDFKRWLQDGYKHIEQADLPRFRDYIAFTLPNGVRLFFKELGDNMDGTEYVMKVFLGIGPAPGTRSLPQTYADIDATRFVDADAVATPYDDRDI